MDARARVLKGYRNLEVVAYGLGRQHDNHVSHAIHVLRIIKKNDLFFALTHSFTLRPPQPHSCISTSAHSELTTHTHTPVDYFFGARASAKCRM